MPRYPRRWLKRANLHAPSGRSGRAFVLLALAAASVFFGLPMLWLVLSTTRTDAQLTEGPALAFGTFGHLAAAWRHLAGYNDLQLGRWAFNSVVYATGGVVLAAASAIPAGYVLATHDFPGRRMVLLLTLVAMMTPTAAIVLPIFMELSTVGLTNTYAGMILVSGFFPFGVYLAYIYYGSALPSDILNAARIDGCGEWALFARVALPLARPVVSLVAFFSFVASWGNYFLAFILLSDDRLYNLPVGLAALLDSTGALNSAFASEIPIKRPEALLAGLLVVLPVAMLFLFSQRFVREGMLAGAEKG